MYFKGIFVIYLQNVNQRVILDVHITLILILTSRILFLILGRCRVI